MTLDKQIGIMLIVVAALSANAMATPAMTTYSNGTITVSQPRGWTVQINTPAGMISMQENPKRADSPTIVVIRGVYKPGTTAQNLMSGAFAVMGVTPKVTARQVERGGNGLQVLAQATYKGMKIRLAALTVVSPQTNESMFAALLTRRNRFDRLGGMRLLHAVAFSLRRVGAAVPTKAKLPAGAPGPTARRGSAGAPGYTAFPKASLVGAWQRVGVGGMMNRVDIDGRVVGTDSRSNGTNYRFYKSGRYEVLYLAQLRSGMCRSEARISEAGRYEYKKATLTLRPGRHRGSICVCCVGNRKTKVNKRSGVRRYHVRGIAGKPHALVLRGKCAPFMVDSGCSSTDALVNGRKHDIVRDFAFARSSARRKAR